ncbi:HNH endonuclease signature motif containing protein [uncultured Aquabacterium sp.]|uniref:HNH endonuclease n=1 Tax=uncultured Aquabacterium sp. TaxID=158753 RepID=UPI0025F5FC92|nr:HNH endonuclease signature motif containing protein [uncultured Aquabacterium sp.]
MAKIKTLKPRIGVINTSRAAVISTDPQRIRGRKWQARREAWLMLNPLCRHCKEHGRTTMGQEVDHIVPLWMGGTDNESNYQTLCIPCHKLKTAAEAARRADGG